MTQSNRSWARRLLVIVASLALFATACGGGAGPSSDESNAAIAAGEANEPQLTLTSDLSTSEVLDTFDGSITSLREVVTGDRPVLLWYWAPH